MPSKYGVWKWKNANLLQLKRLNVPLALRRWYENENMELSFTQLPDI